MKDFQSKLESWKEATTTSPSGRHLGRYKSLFTYIPENQQESSSIYDYKQSTTDKQSWITKLILAIINYCIDTGHILQRWKTIINTMIFKEDGNYKIHHLRVIHIYEADFNLLLAIKWRNLLREVDRNNLINQGLFGGRPGCEAQSLPFLEELKYDIAYTTRRTLINFDNDAMSCYDRIITSIASLIN